MLERADNVLRVTGPMRYDAATRLLAAGRAQIDAGLEAIDLGAVAEADSSALAVLFAWLRQARSLNAAPRIVNPPAGLLSLAALYGVEAFLPLA